MNRTLLALVSLTSLLAVGCGGDDSSTKNDLAVGTDMAVTAGGDMAHDLSSANADALAQQSLLCPGGSGTCAAVATSTYPQGSFNGTGSLNVVDIDTKATTLDLDSTLDADTTLKIHGGELFILQRDTGSVRIYDPSGFKVKVELPTGDMAHPAGSSYPQDLYVADDGEIWVTLSGNDAAHSLAILDRTAPGTLTYVALPQDPNDTDGNPEPNKLYPCNGKVYVTLQSYTFNGSTMMESYVAGRIAPVDATTHAVGTVITMTGKNPSDIVGINGSCNDVVVANASSFFTVADGTGDLERVDLTTGVATVLAFDKALGGRPSYVASAGASQLFVAEYFDPEMNSSGMTLLSSVKVISFDLSTKTVKGDITGKFGNINFLQVRDGNLYLGAGIFADMEEAGKLARGLYITPADGTPLTAAPIDLKLTPSAIALP